MGRGRRVLAMMVTSMLVAAAVGVGSVDAHADVSTPSVSLSTTDAGAPSTYTVDFMTGSTGVLLTASTITLTAPSGTGFSSLPGSYKITVGVPSNGDVFAPASVATSGSTVTLTLGNDVIGGTTAVIVEASRTSNPTQAGTYALSVSTSQDTTQVPSNTYSIVAPTTGALSTSLSTVTAAPATVPADGSSASTITVTVRDVNGNPVLGQTVVPAHLGFSTVSPSSAVTNYAGQASFSATNSTLQTVTYAANVGSSTISQTAAVTFTAAGGALFGEFPGYSNANGATVDAYLPPSLGLPAGTTAPSYLPAQNAWQGRGNDVINLYSTMEPGEWQLLNPELDQIWNTYNAVPFISWNNPTQPSNGQSGDQQAVPTPTSAGNQDADITAFAQGLSTWLGTSKRVYIRMDWEANGSWYPYAPTANATTCDQLLAQEQWFVLAWQHIHDLVMSTAHFAPNQLQWVFSVYSVNAGAPANCANGASDVARKIYPGDAYVDWTGIDAYSFAEPWGANSTGGLISPAAQFDPMVNELRSLTSKPLSVDEVGAGTSAMSSAAPTPVSTVSQYHTPAEKGAWISQYFSYLESIGVQLALWFNEDVVGSDDFAVFSQPTPMDGLSTGDSTYTSGPTTYNAYSEYAQAVRSCFFDSTDPTNPGLVTDAAFEGIPRASACGQSPPGINGRRR